MNIDVEFHIRHNYPWSKLPANVRQVRKLGTRSLPAATCSRASGLTPGLVPAKGLDLTDPKPADGEGVALGPQGQDGVVEKWDGMVSAGLAWRLRTRSPFHQALG